MVSRGSLPLGVATREIDHTRSLSLRSFSGHCGVLMSQRCDYEVVSQREWGYRNDQQGRRVTVRGETAADARELQLSSRFVARREERGGGAEVCLYVSGNTAAIACPLQPRMFTNFTPRNPHSFNFSLRPFHP